MVSDHPSAAEVHTPREDMPREAWLRSGKLLRVGVLALQGGVIEHARMLESLGADVVLVRRESDLEGSDGLRIDALVLPGGESSTQDRLLRLLDVREPLLRVIDSDIPVLGTCAGLILLSRKVLDPAPEQKSLGVLDVTVRRNAIGPQLVSNEADFQVVASESPGVAMNGIGAHGAVRGALIRAPEIVEVGPRARVIITHEGRLLGATSSFASGDDVDTRVIDPLMLGRITGISFHPELSGDPAFHRAILTQAAQR